jgi:hypothetical protein
MSDRDKEFLDHWESEHVAAEALEVAEEGEMDQGPRRGRVASWLGKSLGVIYMIGYWYYLLSTFYLAWPKLSLFGFGPFAMVQALVSIPWPLWLWLGYRPLMP